MGITTQGIKFEIITTKDEIIYKDENGETLTWVNNDYNAYLVSEMVTYISTVAVSSNASVLSTSEVA